MHTTNVIFLLVPHIHLLDLAGADHVFYEAKEHGASVSVTYCTVNERVATTAGLPVGDLPHFSTVNIQQGDILFVPGADSSYILSDSFAESTELLAWIREAYAKGALVCSICTGAFILARAGLLNGKNCTTHWTCTEKLQHLFPLACVQENILFTKDGTMYTSAGVSSGIDLALFLIAELFGEAFSFTIARQLVVYIRRTGTDEQHSMYVRYRNHVHAGIHSVQDWIIENLPNGFVLDDLADVAFMSTRTLTRQFKKETGISVGEYVRLLRKETAEKLIQNSTYSRFEIARLCGLQSERQLHRIIHS